MGYNFGDLVGGVGNFFVGLGGLSKRYRGLSRNFVKNFVG